MDFFFFFPNMDIPQRGVKGWGELTFVCFLVLFLTLRSTPLPNVRINILHGSCTGISFLTYCHRGKSLFKNISKMCGEIQTDGGFEYRLQALNQTFSGDCEHSWYSEERRLLADPSDPHKLMYPVTSVSSDRLVTSYCVDELHHEIQCHSKGITHETVFRVFNGTDSSGGSTQTPDSHQLWWISALVIFIFLLAFLCFLLRKKIFRDLESGVQKIVIH